MTPTPKTQTAGNIADKLIETLGRLTTQPSTPSPKSKSAVLFERRTKYQRPSPEHERVFRAVATFCGELNFARPRWLTLLGRSGCGKTFLAKEAWRHFMDFARHELSFDAMENRIVGNTGQWVDWRSFSGQLASGGFGRVGDICTDHFVILDDIGTSYDPKGFILSSLDRIANSRLGKWTLITANLPLIEIGRMDARISDRMVRDGNVVLETNLPSWNA